MTIVEQFRNRFVVASVRNLALTAGAALALLGFSHQKANAQNSWSVTYSSNISVGGVSGRPTPAATVYNGSFIVAYTQPSGGVDAWGNHLVLIGQCSYTSCGTFTVVGPGSALAYSNANPSVATVNGTVYVAYVAQVGNPVNGLPDDTMFITSSPDGATNWTTPVPVGTLSNTSVDYSPTMIAYNGNLYIGFHGNLGNIAGGKPIGICVSGTPTLNFSCGGSTPGGAAVTAGYNPGLAVFNNTLYIGYVTDNIDHDMYYVTSSLSSPFAFSNVFTGLSGSQSSCAPHLDVWNGNLNFDVRTNDGAHKFSQRHSTNGTSWSSWPDAHLSMAGEPVIVPGDGLSGSDANYNYLFYTTDDSNAFINIARGQ